MPVTRKQRAPDRNQIHYQRLQSESYQQMLLKLKS